MLTSGMYRCVCVGERVCVCKIQMRTWDNSSVQSLLMSLKEEFIVILVYAILFILKDRWHLSQNTSSSRDNGSKKEQNEPQDWKWKLPHTLWQGRLTRQGRQTEAHCSPALQSGSPCKQTAHKWAGAQRQKHKTKVRKWGCSESDIIAQSLGAVGCGQVGESQSFQLSQPSEDRVERRQSWRTSAVTCWAAERNRSAHPRHPAESVTKCLDCSATSGLVFIPAA